MEIEPGLDDHRYLLKPEDRRGQPHRLGFDLHVPWESPEGTSPGLVSVGLKNVRIGKIEFGLHVLPRKA